MGGCVSGAYGADVKIDHVPKGVRRRTEVLRFGAPSKRKETEAIGFYGVSDGLDLQYARMPSAAAFTGPTASSLTTQRNHQGKLPPTPPPRQENTATAQSEESEYEDEVKERREMRKSRRRLRHDSRKHAPETDEPDEHEGESETERRRRKRSERESRHQSKRHQSKSRSHSNNNNDRSSEKNRSSKSRSSKSRRCESRHTDEEDHESVSVSSLSSRRICTYGDRDLNYMNRASSAAPAPAHSSLVSNESTMPRFNSDTPVGRSWERVQKVMAKRASQASQASQHSTMASFVPPDRDAEMDV